MCTHCRSDALTAAQTMEGRLSDQTACPCPSSRLERFAEPCLLLLLAEEAAHGYELIEKLSGWGLEELAPDTTVVYRTLRRMEREGLVRSEWVPGESGPAKRLYRLTPEGEELLHAWVITIRKNRNALERFLTAYGRHFSKVASKAGG